jgi:hypothetical protein
LACPRKPAQFLCLDFDNNPREGPKKWPNRKTMIRVSEAIQDIIAGIRYVILRVWRHYNRCSLITDELSRCRLAGVMSRIKFARRV